MQSAQDHFYRVGQNIQKTADQIRRSMPSMPSFSGFPSIPRKWAFADMNSVSTEPSIQQSSSSSSSADSTGSPRSFIIEKQKGEVLNVTLENASSYKAKSYGGSIGKLITNNGTGLVEIEENEDVGTPIDPVEGTTNQYNLVPQTSKSIPYRLKLENWTGCVLIYNENDHLNYF